MSKIIATITIPIMIIFLSFVLGQLTYSIPSGISNAFIGIMNFMTYFNNFLPITEIGNLINYAITFQTLAWGAYGGIFLYRKIANKLT